MLVSYHLVAGLAVPDKNYSGMVQRFVLAGCAYILNKERSRSQSGWSLDSDICSPRRSVNNTTLDENSWMMPIFFDPHTKGTE
jgi:hypothetical protein